MADITITCGTCGNRITISEYVDAEFMTCMKCRTKVPIPRKPPEQAPAAQLKLAAGMRGAMEPATDEPHKGPTLIEEVQQNTPFMKRMRKQKRRTWTWGATLAACGVCVALTAGLIYLRFWAPLPPGKHDLVVNGALWLLALMHLSVIVAAFTEDIFHGIMCALIPGYTIYYLFFHVDRYFQRAIVAALLLAFGIDAFRVVATFVHDTYAGISTWLDEGGGSLKNVDVPRPR